MGWKCVKLYGVQFITSVGYLIFVKCFSHIISLIMKIYNQLVTELQTRPLKFLKKKMKINLCTIHLKIEWLDNQGCQNYKYY